MKAKSPLGDDVEQDRLENERARGRDRRACHAPQRDQDEAQADIDRESARVDDGTDALLAQHVEQPLDRSDRRARQEAQSEDEHEMVADRELRTEQVQDRLSHQQQDCGRGQRGPERPFDGLCDQVGQALAVAGDMEAAETMSRRCRHRIIDEGDQRERLGGGVIDRHLGGRPEVLQHQHVGIGQQRIEALDHQDRQRGREPDLEIVGLGTRFDALGQPPVDEQHLPERGRPDRDARHDHRGSRIHRQMCEIGGRHQHGQQDLAGDIGRHQCESDPIVAAGDAFLHVGERIGRHGHASEIERDRHVIAEPWLHQAHDARAEQRDAERNADRQPAAAGYEAAQQREEAAIAIFGNEALGSSAEAEVDRLAEQQHPGPDIDVDAELERAHPAREQDLRAEGQHGARDADEKHRAGEALHEHVLGIEQLCFQLEHSRFQPRPMVGQRQASAQMRRFLGTGECQTQASALEPLLRLSLNSRALE